MRAVTSLGLVLPLTLLAATLLLAACGGDDRPTLTVFAAASLSDVFERAADRFEQEHDVDVRFAFGGSQRLRFQLEQGARADVFASADERQMQRAVEAGVVGPSLDGNGPAEFARNALVLVVSAGTSIDGPDDLAAGEFRLVVAGPEVPAGRLTRGVLEMRGQAALLHSVVSEEDSVRAVLTKVAVGEADAGYVYASDARSAGDDVRTFALAGELRNRYLAAPLAGTREPGLAARFVAFLREPFVQGLLRQAGFEPAFDIGAGQDAGS